MAIQKTSINAIMAQDNIKSKFNSILGGAKAPAFMASVLAVTNGNSKLKNADPMSIITAAAIAATLDLPIDPNLGFSAIVPYGGKAQFQIMYKGFVQLAIRSGQYSKLNCSEVYEDELKSYNPITGDLELTESCNWFQRADGKEDKVVGFYAFFETKNGFGHSIYMSKKVCEQHAKKYSSSYKYDLSSNKKSSKWSTDFNAMALKTVMKQLLSKWGILSIEMQTATTADQAVATDIDDLTKLEYSDNKNIAAVETADEDKKIIDIEPELVEQQQQQSMIDQEIDF